MREEVDEAFYTSSKVIGGQTENGSLRRKLVRVRSSMSEDIGVKDVGPMVHDANHMGLGLNNRGFLRQFITFYSSWRSLFTRSFEI